MSCKHTSHAQVKIVFVIQKACRQERVVPHFPHFPWIHPSVELLSSFFLFVTHPLVLVSSSGQRNGAHGSHVVWDAWRERGCKDTNRQIGRDWPCEVRSLKSVVHLARLHVREHTPTHTHTRASTLTHIHTPTHSHTPTYPHTHTHTRAHSTGP